MRRSVRGRFFFGGVGADAGVSGRRWRACGSSRVVFSRGGRRQERRKRSLTSKFLPLIRWLFKDSNLQPRSGGETEENEPGSEERTKSKTAPNSNFDCLTFRE